VRRDAERSAALLLGADAGPGRLDAVAAAVRSRRVPPRPARFAQRVAAKMGRLDYERAVAEPLQAARRRALGDAAAAPPRFLIRVDEFPHYLAWDEPDRYGTTAFLRFHELMVAAGVPYLIAALPRLSRAPLDPSRHQWRALADDEAACLMALGADGVAYGLHGLDHRTRFDSPRRHSELCGLADAELEERLGAAMTSLAALQIRPRVFVPPFNRFDAGQYAALASRFDVVCGGPESIALLGFHRTPLWRGEAVYLPSYAPLYGTAATVEPVARRLIDAEAGLWAPIVLHWGWEAGDGYARLRSLLRTIGPHTAHWEEFLSAVAASAARPRSDPGAARSARAP
jgi:peptidoglycan/xylan/chitin deacetylase (PgdA/CDA1 family)